MTVSLRFLVVASTSLALAAGCGEDHPFDLAAEDGIVGTVSTEDGVPVSGASIGLVYTTEAVDPAAKPSTGIEFTVPEDGQATVTVLDQADALVRTLADGELPAGEHTLYWDGRDDGGDLVPNGLYTVSIVIDQLESRLALLINTTGSSTLPERANAVTDAHGYFRIPRELVAVGEFLLVAGEKTVEEHVVTGDLTVEVSGETDQGAFYRTVPAHMAADAERLVVNLTLEP